MIHLCPSPARGRVMAGALAAALALASAAPALSQAPGSNIVADIVDEVIDAVVTIASVQRLAPQAAETRLPVDSPLRDIFGDTGLLDRVEALGAGFVIDPDGIIVSAYHVIDEADQVSIVLSDHSRLAAEVIGFDVETDLAVLRVHPPRPLAAIAFAEGDPPRIGSPVIAIGNPFGLGGSVSLGIISGRNRDINTGRYDNYIQTDASINRGNSGGPLIDLDGRVVGINNAILSATGDSIGLGFAVPADMASWVVNQILEHGHVERGFIGTRIQEVTEGLAEGFGLGQRRGALIAGVGANTPASDAGIEIGDIILSFDGLAISGWHDLPRLVATAEVGSTVPITLFRDGVELGLSLRIDLLREILPPANPSAVPALALSASGTIDAHTIGLSLSAMTAPLRDQYAIAPGVDGVVITNVASGSLASERRIDRGEVILQVGTGPDSHPILTPADVDDRLAAAAQSTRSVVILLLAAPSGSTRYEWVRLPR